MTRFIRALGASLALAFLVVAPPVFLVLAIGNPWPDHGVSLATPLSDGAVMSLIALVLWVVWAQMTLSFLVEAYAALADRAVDVRLPVLGMQQDLARLLIGAIITSSVAATPLGAGLVAYKAAAEPPSTGSSTSAPSQTHLGPTVGASEPVSQSRDSSAKETQPTDATTRQTRAGVLPDDARSAAAPAASVTITVQRGDTLWSLAEQYFDRGESWTEIDAANRGQVMVDGTVFTSANSIRPGWRLTIPGAHSSQTTASNEPRIAAHEVEPGDTLWSIAQSELGDGARYPELFEASRDLAQPGGQRLSNPDHIEPGWEVRVPAADDATHPSDREATGLRQPSDDSTATGSHSHAGTPGDSRGDITGDAQGDIQADSRAGRGRTLGEDEPGDDSSASGAPSPVAPSGEATPGDAAADDPGEDATVERESSDADTGPGRVLDAAWVLPGLTGGGVLLAGALYAGLQQRRRRQSRARRPGRAVTAPPPETTAAEMTFNAVGGTSVATVAFMDEALRRLADQVRVQGTVMPALAAVQLHEDLVILHLSEPAELPEPWQGSPDRVHWSCSTSTTVDDLGPAHRWADAPYPLLVTVGVDRGENARAGESWTVGSLKHGPDTQGDVWLLNCEELGTLEVVGDGTVAHDFVRHLAAQLAVNPWSQQVSVHCVGVAEETASLGDGVRYHDLGPGGGRAIDDVLAKAIDMVDRTTSQGVDTATARSYVPDDDVWPAHVLLVAAGPTAREAAVSGSGVTEQHGTDEDLLEPDSADRSLGELRHLVSRHVGRTGTAIVIIGDAVSAPRLEAVGNAVRVTGDGRALLEEQRLALDAVGLSVEEARGCALLYTHSEHLDDVAVPVDEEATEGWESYVDRTGAFRRELTVPRDTAEEDLEEPATSLLPAADEEYVTTAPMVADDLEALAPKIPESLRQKMQTEDPTLDADLADWADPHCPRPKLTLLGPVEVRAHGRPLAKYKALCTELVAYLAVRPRSGATRDEVAEAIGWNDPARVRKYIDLARHWLGENPETREHYLPHANRSAAAKARGVNVYQVTAGLLSDWDLFRRLRARGNLEDLVVALGLVSGRPFDQLRPGGWNWLYQGDPHDQYAAHAIADVAFIVVTQSLRDNDLHQARAATEVAMLAVPDEQTVQLCQVALTTAEGDETEAKRILLEDVCNAAEYGDGPDDLPERTQEILRTHRWMAS